MDTTDNTNSKTAPTSSAAILEEGDRPLSCQIVRDKNGQFRRADGSPRKPKRPPRPPEDPLTSALMTPDYFYDTKLLPKLSKNHDLKDDKFKKALGLLTTGISLETTEDLLGIKRGRLQRILDYQGTKLRKRRRKQAIRTAQAVFKLKGFELLNMKMDKGQAIDKSLLELLQIQKGPEASKVEINIDNSARERQLSIIEQQDKNKQIILEAQEAFKASIVEEPNG